MARIDKRTVPSAALDENLRAVSQWEAAALERRSTVQQFCDRITARIGTGVVLVSHLAWFTGWLAINTGLVPAVAPFDPFPFPLLTMIVSLEAIFLALFVLISQNRLAHQADTRSHLDLQIDLLAEREMTAAIQLLWDLTAHFGIKVSLTPEQIADLAKHTDIAGLVSRLDEPKPNEPEDGAQAHSAGCVAR